MHVPIKIGTSIYDINLYERHSLSEFAHTLLIFTVNIEKLIWLYRFKG